MSLLGSAGLAIAACATPTIRNFDNSFELQDEDPVLAVVGRKINVVDAPYTEEERNGGISIILDARFQARYEVMELVHGRYEKPTVDFVAFDHYDDPRFAEHQFALLYLVEDGGHLYHIKYQSNEVHPTKDGRFASCGNPFVPEDQDEPVDTVSLQPIQFDPPVVIKISDYLIHPGDDEGYTEEEIKALNRKTRDYFSAPNFKVYGNVAVCMRGLYSRRLFELWEATYFKDSDEIGITLNVE